MAERPDLPKVEPEEKPSIFNNEMAQGYFFGKLGRIITGAALLKVSPALSNLYVALPVLAGTALGADLGRNQGEGRARA